MTQESIAIEGTGTCTATGMESVGKVGLGDAQVSANSRGESDARARANTTDGSRPSATVSVIQMGTNAAGQGQYKAADSGPVLAYTIFSIYKQAADFCAAQKRQVATVELKQDPERQTVMHKLLRTELVFECAQNSQTCGMSIPEGGVVQMDTGDVTLKDGAILHYKHCSDAALSDSPPPP
jgi:hypothetical protein